MCFNPLPSCEGRHVISDSLETRSCFNPLPSCEGRPSASKSFANTMSLQSTSLLRGKTASAIMEQVFKKLQSTSLLRGKTKDMENVEYWKRASIHFPLAREDSAAQFRSIQPLQLQSTSLLRGKTEEYELFQLRACCFNPLPSCEGRRQSTIDSDFRQAASIHFPLAREDDEL